MTRYLEYLIPSVNFSLAKKYMKTHSTPQATLILILKGKRRWQMNHQKSSPIKSRGENQTRGDQENKGGRTKNRDGSRGTGDFNFPSPS
jgi:hypothetical protein